MDFEAIYNPPEYHKIFTLAEIEALKENTDPSTILIRAFVGGWRGAQSDPLEVAIGKLRDKYGPLGYTIIFEMLTNDEVRNKLKWDSTQLFSGLLAADIHMVTTHTNQGMLAKGGNDSWNMEALLSNYDRLR